MTPQTEIAPLQEPTTVPAQQPTGDGGYGGPRWPSAPPVLAAAAGVAAAGAVALVVRRLIRRNGGPLRTGSGGESRRKGAGTGDVGRVVLAARALLLGFAEMGFDDLRLIVARESTWYLEFALDCAPGDADAVARSRFDLGRRLACAVDMEVVSSTRIQLKLSRFQRLAGLLFGGEVADEGLLLVPVGAAENGVYYLNLAAAGSAVVIGSAHDTRQLLAAWLASLAAVHGPEQLAFVSAGTASEGTGDMAGLPHFDGRAERTIEELVGELEETVAARDAASVEGRRAALVAVVRLASDGRDEVEKLETVLRRGPELGIYVVALAEGPAGRETIGPFGATVALGGLEESLEPDETTASGVGAEDLVLLVGREPPLILKPVTVRSDVLRPAGRQASQADIEYLGSAEPPEESVVGDELEEQESGYENPPPDDQEQPALGGDSASGTALQDEEETPPREAPDGSAIRQAPLLLEEENDSKEAAVNGGGTLFSVRCFGSFRVEVDNREVAGWTIQKARELLAYLIARGGAPVLRDEVAEALWPDGDRVQVEHLLSNAAYYLRRTLKNAAPAADIQPFVTSAQRYHLRSGIFRVDVDAFDAHVRRAETLEGANALAEYERALGVYQRDFMGSEPYEWAETYRREYQRRYAVAAHRAAKLALDCRANEKALQFYQGILARDPIDEEAARGLMRCYARSGDLNGVRKVYKVLCESLRRELEDEKAEPLPETATLFRTDLGPLTASQGL